MSSFLDASVIVCHLTGDPVAQRAHATAIFDGDVTRFVSDVTVADTVHLLESAYRVDRHLIATSLRSLLVRDNIACVDAPVTLRALGIYEIDGLRYPVAHSVALAESTGVDEISSLDSSVDRVQTVRRSTL